MRKAAAAVVLFANLAHGTAQAGWDDSHGYRGIRVYAPGPPQRNGYFSGITVRVGEWRSHRYMRHRSVIWIDERRGMSRQYR